jgi:hypothetical protein
MASSYGLDIGEWRALPVIVRACDLPGRLAVLPYLDLQTADEDQWQRLIDALLPRAAAAKGLSRESKSTVGKKGLLDDPRYRKITEEIRRLRTGPMPSRGYQGTPDQAAGANAFESADFVVDWLGCKDPNLTEHEKGIRLEKALGQFVSPVFAMVREHRRFPTEEFDMVLQLVSEDPVWRSFGPWVPVEAKNWSGQVGQREVSAFFQKVRLHKLRLALFVSMTGFTKDAVQQTRLLNASADYPTLLLISGDEIEQVIEDCTSPEEFLKDKLLLTTFGG